MTTNLRFSLKHPKRLTEYGEISESGYRDRARSGEQANGPCSDFSPARKCFPFWGNPATHGLVTNRFRFEDYLKAYHFIDQAGDKAMKVLISLDEEN